MACHPFRYSPARRERGAALVVALLVFALCTALIVAMKSEFTLYYQRGANLFLGEQAYAYLRGGEDLASMALLLDYEEDEKRERLRDDLTEIWAQQATPYALDDGGWLMGGLQDLQGRFNLNSLQGDKNNQGGQGSQETRAGQTSGVTGPKKARFTPSQQQFIRLLQTIEEPVIGQQEAIQITESIADWLDSDGKVSPSGAEDDFYYSRTPAHRAANRPMSSVSELRAVANVSPEVYCALLPLVSVWPKTAGAMNIHTAPLALLRTINAKNDLTPLSEADALALEEQRSEAGFADMAEFLAHPVLEGKELGDMTEVLGENTSYFLLSASVEVADRTAHLYSVLERNQGRITALVRHSGGAEPMCARLANVDADSDEEGDGTR